MCGLAFVERIFGGFSVSVKGPEKDKNVHGLAAYMCKKGHVFFVRLSDFSR
jgi:hypothetical protein